MQIVDHEYRTICPLSVKADGQILQGLQPVIYPRLITGGLCFMKGETGTPLQPANRFGHPVTGDPAAFASDTNRKCEWLIRNAWESLNPWERNFLSSTYGRHKLTRKQHTFTWNLYRKYGPGRASQAGQVRPPVSDQGRRDPDATTIDEGSRINDTPPTASIPESSPAIA